MSSRSSLESTYSAELQTEAPQSLHSSNSTEDSAYRVRSFASTISRVATVKRAISNTRERIGDDNTYNDALTKERRATRLGREMSNIGFEEAVRIATYKSENADAIRQRKEAAVTAEEKTIQKEEELQELERVVTGANVSSELPPPDKGYAWVMAGVGFGLLFSTWGVNGSYGVFLSYWLNNETFPGATSKDYALIGSMVLCFAQALAPLSQMISAITGTRTVMVFGTVFQLAGYLGCSWATKIWHVYLCQGFLVGMGFALVFNAPFTLISEWFDKKRGISSGISVCASGVGGVVFALIVQTLIDKTGSFRWSMRAIGIVAAAINVLITVLTKPRIPKPILRTKKDIQTRAKIMFNTECVKLWYVHSETLWFMLVQGCYIMALFSLSSYATFMGFTQQDGAHMTTIYNGCQAIGRFSIGLLSDYTGRTNLAIVLNIVMAILIFAMWTNTFTYPVLVAYSVLSGLTFGVASTLNQPIMADQVPPELFPSAWSFENFFMGAWCLAIEVIALGEREVGARRPFLKAQLNAGGFAAGGLLFILPLRELKIRNFVKERLRATEKQIELNTSQAEDKAAQDGDLELLAKRRDHYNTLLGKGILSYLTRLFYPLKV